MAPVEGVRAFGSRFVSAALCCCVLSPKLEDGGFHLGLGAGWAVLCWGNR